ncbi:NAD-dependent epimerase/dehydratase family protein [Pseudorhodobacter sp. W20_MBD10_FR17]|uniref:NAD-dependent epimerase/dehydratase family protein n=1 Tax=Pseudorhodobacter sp. W20_MBD10_FR17 TaxID=3240266 RepID=UPI003F962705
MTRPILLGATGRVGQLLARVWPAGAASAHWQYRSGADAGVIAGFPGTAVCWDILGGPAPDLPPDITAMIVLAGVTGDNKVALAQNTTLALTAVRAARAAGIPRVLIASTQAVYGTLAPRVSEGAACAPTTAYGIAKLEMEHALAPYPEVTCLRLGNVAGADTLLRTAAHQAVTLDRFADGTTPRRSYIGPVTLADVLLALSDPALVLPPVLNVASPGVIEMGEVLAAAEVALTYRNAPCTALALLELDVARLMAFVPLAPLDANDLITQARKGGWRSNKA